MAVTPLMLALLCSTVLSGHDRNNLCSSMTMDACSMNVKCEWRIYMGNGYCAMVSIDNPFRKNIASNNVDIEGSESAVDTDEIIIDTNENSEQNEFNVLVKIIGYMVELEEMIHNSNIINKLYYMCTYVVLFTIFGGIISYLIKYDIPNVNENPNILYYDNSENEQIEGSPRNEGLFGDTILGEMKDDVELFPGLQTSDSSVYIGHVTDDDKIVFNFNDDSDIKEYPDQRLGSHVPSPCSNESLLEQKVAYQYNTNNNEIIQFNRDNNEILQQQLNGEYNNINNDHIFDIKQNLENENMQIQMQLNNIDDRLNIDNIMQQNNERMGFNYETPRNPQSIQLNQNYTYEEQSSRDRDKRVNEIDRSKLSQTKQDNYGSYNELNCKTALMKPSDLFVQSYLPVLQPFMKQSQHMISVGHDSCILIKEFQKAMDILKQYYTKYEILHLDFNKTNPEKERQQIIKKANITANEATNYVSKFTYNVKQMMVGKLYCY